MGPGRVLPLGSPGRPISPSRLRDPGWSCHLGSPCHPRGPSRSWGHCRVWPKSWTSKGSHSQPLRAPSGLAKILVVQGKITIYVQGVPVLLSWKSQSSKGPKPLERPKLVSLPGQSRSPEGRQLLERPRWNRSFWVSRSNKGSQSLEGPD